MRLIFALLLLVSIATVGDAAEKFPVPQQQELVASYKIINEVFGEQIKAAQNSEAKSELAMSFLTTAATTNDRFEKYALLEQAQVLALGAKDLQLYFRTLDAISETFQIDKVKQWSEHLANLMEGQVDEATLRTLAETDFLASSDPAKRSDAADAWYTLSGKLKGEASQIAKDRAVLHYRAAMPGLQGLTKLRAQKRLQECLENKSTSPASHASSPSPTSGSQNARYGHGRILEIDCTKGLTAREAQKAQRNAARAYGAPIEISNKLGMHFYFIPAGTFLMGSPENEPHRKKDETQSVVKITEPFYMGVTEVTQEQYWKVTGQKPSQQKDNPSYPVETVNWPEANDFCRKLSKLDGERTYQLPTAAQFEYASRAGVLEPTYGPLEKISWSAKNAHSKTKPVAMLVPNAWGLYDTLGNVWEWCQEKTDAHSGNRIRKGASVNFWPADHRFAVPSSSWETSRFSDLGFRVCIPLNAK